VDVPVQSVVVLSDEDDWVEEEDYGSVSIMDEEKYQKYLLKPTWKERFKRLRIRDDMVKTDKKNKKRGWGWKNYEHYGSISGVNLSVKEQGSDDYDKPKPKPKPKPKQTNKDPATPQKQKPQTKPHLQTKPEPNVSTLSSVGLLTCLSSIRTRSEVPVNVNKKVFRKIEIAMDSIEKGEREITEGNNVLALELYGFALHNLMDALRAEPDEEIRKQIQDQLDVYLSQAESLKSQIISQQQSTPPSDLLPENVNPNAAEFLEIAIEWIEQAQLKESTLDSDAFFFYQKALDNFRLALQYETNSNMRAMIQERIENYSKKLEAELKQKKQNRENEKKKTQEAVRNKPQLNHVKENHKPKPNTSQPHNPPVAILHAGHPPPSSDHWSTSQEVTFFGMNLDEEDWKPPTGGLKLRLGKKKEKSKEKRKKTTKLSEKIQQQKAKKKYEKAVLRDKEAEYLKKKLWEKENPQT